MPYINRSHKKKFKNKSPSVDENCPENKHFTEISSEQNQQEALKPNAETPVLSSEETEEALKLIKDIPALASSVSDVIKNVTKKIEDDELQMEKGLSFLDLKNLNMLNYISNLSYIILRKLNGKQIENDPAIKRLAELRVVMEKMRPIEDKLKYQINKLLASTSSESIDTNDPLKFRANPDSLTQNDNSEDDDEEEADEQQKKSKVYVPPKISAAYFDEENMLERKMKALEHAQKRALSSRMLNELRQEYDTGPEEIKETVDPYKLKLAEELQERERFEEDFMSRLPVTKKQRHDMRQLTTVTNFESGLDDLSALDKTPNSTQLKKSKWKKGKFKSKGKKKGFKRKH